MRNKLIVVMNQEIQPIGRILNAVGHMIIGISPRIPRNKFPDVELYLSSGKLVRHFKQKAFYLHSNLTDNLSAFSDFAHTTSDGSAKDHEIQTSNIREADINYFASCICASSNNLSALDDFLKNDNYTRLCTTDLTCPEKMESEFSLQNPINYPKFPDFTEETKKFSIILSNKLSVPNSIHTLIRACLLLGSSISTEKLRLHQYLDADNVIHPGMSEYGLVVLKTKNSAKLQEISHTVTSVNIDSIAQCRTLLDALVAVAIFGKTEVVNEITKRNISLWDGKFQSDDFFIHSTNCNPRSLEQIS